MAENYTWIPFYEEFATKLLEYEYDGKELFIQLENVRRIFVKWGRPALPLDFDNVDPFTVIALFNRDSQKTKPEKREIITEQIKKDFEISHDIPRDFNGIPLLIYTNYLYYKDEDPRVENERIEKIWKLFSSAIKLADSIDDEQIVRKSFIDNFNVVNEFCVTSFITYALFWSRPNYYIALDSNNRKYIAEQREIDNKVWSEFPKKRNDDINIGNQNLSGENYLKICEGFQEACKSEKYGYKTIAEFSKIAKEWHDDHHKKANNKTTSLSKNSKNDVDIIKHSKNIILYGPPGTGKTYRAILLAAVKIAGIEDKKDWLGELKKKLEKMLKDKIKKIEGNKKLKDNKELQEEKIDEIQSKIDNISQTDNIHQVASEYLKLCHNFKLVQFHPSYSYNDFMETIDIAKEGGAGIKDQVFKEFANAAVKEAKKKKPSPYVLIIDEINRANVSEVLGELLYSIEYRGEKITTSISSEEFTVPDNLYIFGTMNTADRSLQNLDYAVRRRFDFVEVVSEKPEPQPDEEDENKSTFYKISETDKNGNEQCFMDKAYDTVCADVEASVARGVEAKSIMPGISYFIVNAIKNEEGKYEPDMEHFRYKMQYELIPLLQEYAKDGLFTKMKRDVDGQSMLYWLQRNDEEDNYESRITKGYEYLRREEVGKNDSSSRGS